MKAPTQLVCGACRFVYPTPVDALSTWSHEPVALPLRCPHCGTEAFYSVDGVAHLRRSRSEPR